MAIKEIKRIEGGFIIYTSKVLLNAEREAIKRELRSISAESLGMLFFRVA